MIKFNTDTTKADIAEELLLERDIESARTGMQCKSIESNASSVQKRNAEVKFIIELSLKPCIQIINNKSQTWKSHTKVYAFRGA